MLPHLVKIPLCFEKGMLRIEPFSNLIFPQHNKNTVILPNQLSTEIYFKKRLALATETVLARNGPFSKTLIAFFKVIQNYKMKIQYIMHTTYSDVKQMRYHRQDIQNQKNLLLIQMQKKCYTVSGHPCFNLLVQ